MFVLSLVTLYLGFTLLASASPLPVFGPLERNVANTNVVQNSLFSDSSSPTVLSLARRFNSTGSSNVLKFDQARAKAMQQRGRTDQDPSSAADASVINVDATSQAVSYVVEVIIGGRTCWYHLLVDTGSSNTWIGADSSNPYVPTESSRLTGDGFLIQYGSGAVVGYEVLETVIIAEGLVLSGQSIGVAVYASGMAGIDGILGIGPSALTRGRLRVQMQISANTVTDTAWYSGLLDARVISIFFQPSNTIDSKNGELTFGGIDKTKFRGPLHYTPLTTTGPTASFVGVMQTIVYGDESNVVLAPSAGILDTGTTLILIAPDAFKRYQAYTGGVPDDTVGLLSITPDQYAKLRTLVFIIGGVRYELTPNAQIWPRALNEALGGTSDKIYLIVNDLGSMSEGGMEFINGMSFLERFYMVYDIAGGQAGLAYTQYTYADIN
ncbi:aspartic peptidase A1 [Polyporus arcularius HHB13444]|uniref:Aspartic peptidase A1 n=1 Tax=Polyporus arcularius HHB13444 TaxID=1314778 RepID=A0A5C3P033_9APHY|nr:aspartic peptidase A1 [Polyporus arcularius HHB13444]